MTPPTPNHLKPPLLVTRECSAATWWELSAWRCVQAVIDERTVVGDEGPQLDSGLLQELLNTYGPCGQHGAVRDACRRVLEPQVDTTWVDPAGNLVGVIRGGDAPAIRVMAHMDELSMIVKRVEADGSLHVTQLGAMYPGNFGLGPVAILGERETLCGVLTLGSEHTTKESQRIWETKQGQGDTAMDWNHVYVFTDRTSDEVSAAGVRPGTRDAAGALIVSPAPTARARTSPLSRAYVTTGDGR
jgi:hypothetical protein